jgi:pantetheine-phosphate adenylyltransferase
LKNNKNRHMKKAIFPGSFDPFTLGHQDIVEKALKIFNEVVISVGETITKKYLLSPEERMEAVKLLYKNESRVKVRSYDILTADLCDEENAGFIIRGLRNSNDFEYEKLIALNNKALNKKVETVFVLSNPEIAHINSTIVREIIKNNGNIDSFVPSVIAKLINSKK